MSQPFVREAQFAGSWYPISLEEAESYWDPQPQRVPAKAVVCPHAGWMYSGKVAGEVYGQVAPADTFIILGPNHTGRGSAMTSLFSKGEWKLPQNSIFIDEEIAEDILHRSEFLSEDADAHAREHSIEVQIPFVLLLNAHAKLVPIVMREYDSEIYHDLGRSIAAACRKYSRTRILLVASTDMTHYEPQASAEQKDQAAIERMTAVDPEGLCAVVQHLGISMCGAGPAAAVLTAARALGATEGRLVRYATSGDVTHDTDAVVGYAGLVVT